MQLYNFHPLSISTLRHIKGCQHEIHWALKQWFCAQNGCNNGMNIISMNLDIGEYILQWRWYGTLSADLTRAKKTSFFWIYSQFNGLCFTFRTGLCKIYSFIIYFPKRWINYLWQDGLHKTWWWWGAHKGRYV